MGSARPWFVLAVALVPAGASADNHFADIMGAGSGSAQSALGGVQVTAAFLLGKRPPDYHVAPKPRQWSLLADGTAYFVGTHEGEELKEFSYAAGVRRTRANNAGTTLLSCFSTSSCCAVSRHQPLGCDRCATNWAGVSLSIRGITRSRGMPSYVSRHTRP